MSKVVYSLAIALISSVYALAVDFDNLDSMQQQKVISSLSEAVACCDIEVIQSRIDEPFRSESKLDAKYLSTLDMKPLRFVERLKGDFGISSKDPLYIYTRAPDPHYTRYTEYVRSGASDRSRYNPLFLNDDSFWVAFLLPRSGPRNDSIKVRAKRYRSEMEPFVQDAQEMDEVDLLRKYGLSDAFQGSVYEVYEDCTFLIQYPPASWETTKSMEMNQGILESMMQGAKKKQEWVRDNSLSLTNKEVSEIIFIAYLLDSIKELDQFEKLSAEVAVLQNSIETNIARRLLKALVGSGSREKGQSSELSD